jgi:hypothetical protein
MVHVNGDIAREAELTITDAVGMWNTNSFSSMLPF